jgi:hypothetical protein
MLMTTTTRLNGTVGAIRLMVFMTHAILLWEKNTIPWLDKFKRTEWSAAELGHSGVHRPLLACAQLWSLVFPGQIEIKETVRMLISGVSLLPVGSFLPPKMGVCWTLIRYHRRRIMSLGGHYVGDSPRSEEWGGVSATAMDIRSQYKQCKLTARSGSSGRSKIRTRI